MNPGIRWKLALLIFVLVFNTIALTILVVVPRSQMATLGKVVTSGVALIGGPFTLTAADGRTVTNQTYLGKWQMIYFGYTFCPDACPTALSNMSTALQELGADAGKVQALFITVDPERDTRPVMSSYLESFDPRIVGLVGTEAQTEAVATAYRVYFKPHKNTGANYLVDHSAYFYLMDPDGKFVDVIEGVTPGDQIAAKLRTLINSQSD
jgi:protein SCO1/2